MVFDDCLKLAASNRDYRFEAEYLPVLQEAFERWLPGLAYTEIRLEGQGYVAIQLSASVEAEIAATMPDAPYLAWGLASLAYVMLRLKAAELPGLRGYAGCLPLPPVDGKLAAALTEAGLWQNGRLNRQFCLFTYSPLSTEENGCAGCALAAECPQLN